MLFYRKHSYLKPKNLHRVCVVFCDSAGVMYWGDAKLDKIEMANLDGTGRTTLGTENVDAHYFAFTFHAGNIYITDWTISYACVVYGVCKTADDLRWCLCSGSLNKRIRAHPKIYDSAFDSPEYLKWMLDSPPSHNHNQNQYTYTGRESLYPLWAH